MARIIVDVSDDTREQLQKLYDSTHSSPTVYRPESFDEMIRYILVSMADGHRRPGSWERGLLQQMGLAE